MELAHKSHNLARKFLHDMINVGIIGSGAMGSGIAQVAAQAGHSVILNDTNAAALEKAKANFANTFSKLVEKGKVTTEEATTIQNRISYSTSLNDFANCGLVIEAIVENLDVKRTVFQQLEGIVSESCVLASNTSSLSITSIAASCNKANRVMGIHFFNPAPLMPLVEIIPALQSDNALVDEMKALITSWKKVPVIAKDTPGFIVNRVARTFYGEALRIYEEGLADMATIDAAMREIGGFKMGPFELMDLIGNDVNYAVTESVFAAFYFDQRFKPSITQKKIVEAKWYGKKSGRGFYDYSEGATMPQSNSPEELKKMVFDRIIVMLINEAFDTHYLKIASAEDIDLAMTKGVNYPKGLIAWGKEIGLQKCVFMLDNWYDLYHEDRYRASVGLRVASVKTAIKETPGVA